LVQSTVQQERKNRRGQDLVDKHFPPSNCLHKIFNRNSVKVSYSCMDNCKSIISKHNTRILSRPKSTTQTSSSTNSATCNCNNSNECPLQNKCLFDCIFFPNNISCSESYKNDNYFLKVNWKKRTRLIPSRCHKQDWINHLKLVHRTMKR
jgi:hypothetical protein